MCYNNLRFFFETTRCVVCVTFSSKWKFITERAAWQGGFYERLISMIKHHLKRVLGIKLVSKDIFEAITAEIEFVLNNRLIAFVSESDVRQDVLRPIDFLLRSKVIEDPLLTRNRNKLG